MKHQNLVWLTLATFVLSACGGGGSSSSGGAPAPATTLVTFEVVVDNLTNGQPLSPPGVIAHNGNFTVFSVGQPASVELEELAEGGDPGALLGLADASADVFATAAADGPVGPGQAGPVRITVDESEVNGMTLSAVTMLVNTNDAFTVATVQAGDLAIGETTRLRTIAYDAGTEADDEAPGTIPGPAVGGEGFNAVRDDNADRVSMHSGTVTLSDGLLSSALNEQHRFDNPVMSVSVTRLN